MLLNNLKVLVLDFETYDPNLLKYGAGWAFKIHYSSYPFDVIGVGLNTWDNMETYLDFKDNNSVAELKYFLLGHDAIVCHNAGYDIGILYYLFPELMHSNKHLIIDTIILAKLTDQNIEEFFKTKKPYVKPYALDTLTRYWNLSEVKETSILTDYVWESGTYQKHIKDTTNVNKHTRPSEETLSKYCYLHLKDFPTSLVSQYCLQDIRATTALFERLIDNDINYQRYSDLIRICIESKARGVRIDLNKVRALIKEFSKIRDEIKQDILELIINEAGIEFSDISIDSPKQLGEVLVIMGYQLTYTDKGNPSTGKAWLESQAHNDTLCNKLLTYRKTSKMTRDFLKKVLDYQEEIPSEYRNKDIGMLFPSLKPGGATKTFRFTSGGGSGCKELSIHQIPRRDEEFGKPIREIFIPFENEKIICGDFNGQESRIQVHYAALLNCSGVKVIVDAWYKDPNMKYHHKVAELTKLDYDDAKTTNLGLSYGMGKKKLCTKLGLSFAQGTALLDQYHHLLPFMNELQQITEAALFKNGYVRTLGGRKLYLDPSYTFKGRIVTQERKGLSKLIQGSAADQCIEAMIKAWKAGLKILFSVHDEIVISSSCPDVDITTLRHCMESAYELKVPVIADCNIGDSWGEAK